MKIRTNRQYDKAKKKIECLFGDYQKSRALVSKYERLESEIHLYELAESAENFYESFKDSEEVEAKYPGWKEKYKSLKEKFDKQ